MIGQEGGCCTHVGPVLDEQLGAGQVALHTGRVEGGDPVQGAQVHTRTLSTNHPAGVWFPNKLMCNKFLLCIVGPDETCMSCRQKSVTTRPAMRCPHLSKEALESQDASVERGIVNGRPVRLSIWVETLKTQELSEVTFLNRFAS